MGTNNVATPMIMMTAMYGDKQCGNTDDYDDSNVWGQTMWQHR